MKKAWKKPEINVLDVSETMKGWKNPKPPRDPGTPDPGPGDPELDS